MVRRKKSHAEVPNINEAILNSYANKMMTQNRLPDNNNVYNAVARTI
jgi:hypothetical protein